jgi:hypothetical protein
MLENHSILQIIVLRLTAKCGKIVNIIKFGKAREIL